MFESNYFTMLMKPTYGNPLDTAEDIVDSGLRVVVFPGQESIVEMLKNSPFIITRTIAERTIVPKVIFCNISILISNFPQRLSTLKFGTGLKMRLLTVLM